MILILIIRSLPGFVVCVAAGYGMNFIPQEVPLVKDIERALAAAAVGLVAIAGKQTKIIIGDFSLEVGMQVDQLLCNTSSHDTLCLCWYWL